MMEPTERSPRPEDRTERTRVLYDGDCPVCRNAAERLRRLDRDGALELADVRDESVLASTPHVDRDRALRRIQVIEPGGGPAVEGYRGLVRLARRLPALRWVAPLLGWGPIVPIGERVYDFVARHRHRLPGARSGARVSR